MSLFSFSSSLVVRKKMAMIKKELLESTFSEKTESQGENDNYSGFMELPELI